MPKQNQRVFWSVLLILFGIFFLLDNFRLIPGDMGDLFWAGIFGLGALIGLSTYLGNADQWWVLFPSFVFLGIAGVLIADILSFRFIDGGSIFMFMLSLAFWIIFAREKKHWWAAIPGGVLTSIAATMAVDSATRIDSGGLLFIGLGLTFGLLWLIRRESPTGWAKWPAMILLFFGLFFPFVERFDRIWPLILIVVGSWMLIKNIIRAKKANALPSAKASDLPVVPLVNNEQE